MMSDPELEPAPRVLLRQMFDAAIASAQPALCVPPHLPAAPRGRLIVVGAGKASAAMARAVEQNWSGPLSGLVVTRYGYAVPCESIDIVEAAHPVPDAAGMRAAQRMLERVAGLQRGRPGAVPFFRRRLGAVAAARTRSRPRLEAGGEPRTAGVRRHHQRDELRAPPSLRHQRRPFGRCLPPGARAHVAHLRCARRPADRYRVGPHGGGSDHLRRCARHRAPLRHRTAGAGARVAGERTR